jgi:hypothetical protein
MHYVHLFLNMSYFYLNIYKVTKLNQINYLCKTY